MNQEIVRSHLNHLSLTLTSPVVLNGYTSECSGHTGPTAIIDFLTFGHSGAHS